MKHKYSQSYANKSPRSGDFMNKRRDELIGKYGGKWVWYPAHGQLIILPTIDFKAYNDKRRYGNISDLYDDAEQVEKLLSNKPQTLISLFNQLDLSMPELSFACAYLIKEKGYKFEVCRTGNAVVIKK